jgi:hypothetical protein
MGVQCFNQVGRAEQRALAQLAAFKECIGMQSPRLGCSASIGWAQKGAAGKAGQ